MGQKDPRVDAYIDTAAPFAQPPLRVMRAATHAGCQGMEQTIKWRMPFFIGGGHILGHMAAFKQHCAVGFWQAGEAIGHFGRVTCRADLPSAAELKAIVRTVASRMAEGAKSLRSTKAASAMVAGS